VLSAALLFQLAASLSFGVQTPSPGVQAPARARPAEEVKPLLWDVIARDAGGLPVPLPESLRVLVDGDEVQYRRLVEPAAPVAAAGDREGERRWRLIILLDVQASRRLTRRAILAQLGSLSDRMLDQGAEVMVAALDGRLRIRQELTSDRELVHDALSGLGEMVAPGLGDREDELQREIDELAEAAAGSDVDPSAAVDLLQKIRSFADEATAVQEQALTSLQRLARGLSCLDGRKVLLWIGDGYSSRPGRHLVDDWTARFPTAAFIAGGEPTDLPETSGETALFAMVQYAAGARLIVFPLETSPDRTGRARSFGGAAALAGAGGSGGFDGTVAGLSTLQDFESSTFVDALAFGTGGRVLRFTRQLAAELEGVAAELDRWEVLRLEIPQRGDNSFREVRVEPAEPEEAGGATGRSGSRGEAVASLSYGSWRSPNAAPAVGERARDRRPSKQDAATVDALEGIELRFAAGFPDRSADVQMADRTYGAALLGRDSSGLAIKLDPGEPHASNGSFVVPVAISLPLGRIVVVPSGESHTGRVSVLLTSQDEAGALGEMVGHHYPVELSNSRLLEAVGSPLAFSERLVLEPGRHRLAVTVRDELAGVEAVKLVTVDVGGEGR